MRVTDEDILLAVTRRYISTGKGITEDGIADLLDVSASTIRRRMSKHAFQGFPGVVPGVESRPAGGVRRKRDWHYEPTKAQLISHLLRMARYWKSKHESE